MPTDRDLHLRIGPFPDFLREVPMSINCRLQAVDAATAGRLLENPNQVADILDNLSGSSFNVHKAWHAIHYLLTGSADGGQEPQCFLLEGGALLCEPDGDADFGYGPPRLLQPAQVRAFDGVLQPINRLSVLRERFDHARMVTDGVYCMNDDDEDEDLEFTAEFFKGLRRFIQRAAEAGQAVVISMY